MLEKRLGRLEKVALGDAWGGDPREFVEWLRRDDNLSVLSNALGRSLRVAEETPADMNEGSVLCCRDPESDALVLVHIAFEPLADDHIAQLLVAAAGVTEVILVWICGEVSERQQQVINWLNQVTTDKVHCFAFEVGFWQIGDSALAPTISVVCRPQSVARAPSASRRGAAQPPAAASAPAVAAARPVSPAPVSATKEPAAAMGAMGSAAKPASAFLEFWLAFNGNLIQRKSPIIGQKPTAANWMSFPLGSPHANLVATVNTRDHYIAVALVLTGPDAKSHFHLLQHSRTPIENEIGAPLEWQELPEKPESRMLLRRFGVDPENRAQWQDQHDWLADKLERFHRAFALRVEAFHIDEDLEGLLKIENPPVVDEGKGVHGGFSAAKG